MIYSKPILHAIDGVNSNAVCADGSSADTSNTCTTGPDVGTDSCRNGNVARVDCMDGNAAIDLDCLFGNFHGNACGTGSGD